MLQDIFAMQGDGKSFSNAIEGFLVDEI